MYTINDIELDIKETEKIEIKLPEEECSTGQFLTLYSRVNNSTDGSKTISYLKSKINKFIEK